MSDEPLNGIYDNTSTMSRERYHDGKLVECLCAHVLFHRKQNRPPLADHALKPWRTYPDVPKVKL